MAGRSAGRTPRGTSLALLIGTLGVVVVAAGCGGGPSGTATVQSATTSTKASGTVATTTTQTATSASASVTTGPVHGALTAHNHAPIVGRPWAYSVRVSTADGKPLSGTVDIEFVFGGVVVGRDNPPTHPVQTGSWRDTVTLPADAAGQPLTFRAVVHTGGGSITLNWPITAKK